MDSNRTDTFKAQKGSKDIVKIVHVSISGLTLMMKLPEYFLCKENKNNSTKSILSFPSRIYQKYLFVFRDEQRTYGFGTTLQ